MLSYKTRISMKMTRLRTIYSVSTMEWVKKVTARLVILNLRKLLNMQILAKFRLEILLLSSLVVRSSFLLLLRLFLTKTMQASSFLMNLHLISIPNLRTKFLRTYSKWLLTRNKQFWWLPTDLTLLSNTVIIFLSSKRVNLINLINQWIFFLRMHKMKKSQKLILYLLTKLELWQKINNLRLSIFAKKRSNNDMML